MSYDDLYIKFQHRNLGLYLKTFAAIVHINSYFSY